MAIEYPHVVVFKANHNFWNESADQRNEGEKCDSKHPYGDLVSRSPVQPWFNIMCRLSHSLPIITHHRATEKNSRITEPLGQYKD